MQIYKVYIIYAIYKVYMIVLNYQHYPEGLYNPQNQKYNFPYMKSKKKDSV